MTHLCIMSGIFLAMYHNISPDSKTVNSVSGKNNRNKRL